MDSLINNMSPLKLNDPACARAYYKAYLINPDIAKICENSKKVDLWSASSTKENTTTTGAGNTPKQIVPRPRDPQKPTTIPPFKCFGCDSADHTLRNCVPIQNLVSKGRLVYDSRNRITLPNNEGGLGW